LKIPRKSYFLSGKFLKSVRPKSSIFYIFCELITYVSWAYTICGCLNTFSLVFGH
jgi:hypothetical protein